MRLPLNSIEKTSDNKHYFLSRGTRIYHDNSMLENASSTPSDPAIKAIISP